MIYCESTMEKTARKCVTGETFIPVRYQFSYYEALDNECSNEYESFKVQHGIQGPSETFNFSRHAFGRVFPHKSECEFRTVKQKIVVARLLVSAPKTAPEAPD